MSDRDESDASAERQREAARWLAIAADDARVARACLGMAQPALGIAAYHCQQAAEKLTKGLLIVAGAGFPRTHDLAELAVQASPLYPDLKPLLEAMAPLTVWNIAYRYPGIEEDDEPDPTPQALRNALTAIDALVQRLAALVQPGGPAEGGDFVGPVRPID